MNQKRIGLNIKFPLPRRSTDWFNVLLQIPFCSSSIKVNKFLCSKFNFLCSILRFQRIVCALISFGVLNELQATARLKREREKNRKKTVATIGGECEKMF